MQVHKAKMFVQVHKTCPNCGASHHSQLCLLRLPLGRALPLVGPLSIFLFVFSFSGPNFQVVGPYSIFIFVFSLSVCQILQLVRLPSILKFVFIGQAYYIFGVCSFLYIGVWGCKAKNQTTINIVMI